MRSEYFPTLRRTETLVKQAQEIEQRTNILTWSGLVEFAFALALSILKHPNCPHCGEPITQNKEPSE